MNEHGVSVVQIGDRLLVTMPPDPGDDTVIALQEQVLQAMDRRRLAGVVLDIGAVRIVDSYFARMIGETGDMIRLMGGATVVTGLRPVVALTLTELGLTLGTVRTAVDVESGLEMLRAEAGRRRRGA